MNCIKNVIIINDFDYVQGGASKVAIDTANILKKMNSQLNVYFFSGVHNDNSTLDDSIIKISTNQGESLKNKNKIKGILNNIYNFKSKKELKKILKELDRDTTIIHIHGWTKSLSSSVFSAIYKMNFKMVLTLHDYFTACPNGGYYNYKKNEICRFKPMSFKCIKCNCDSRNYGYKIFRIIRQFVQNEIVRLPKKVGNVITISNFSEKILKKTLYEKVFIYRVNNPVDFDSNIKNVDFSKNKYYLYVGRVSKEKGTDIFCEAISNLNLKGIVVGDGNELPNLRDRFPNIEFVGWKNSDEVKEYIKNSRALVFPSRWYETMGLTVLETLQFGIPVFVRKTNAAVEYVQDKYQFSTIGELEKLLSMDIENFNISPLNLSSFTGENYYKSIINVYNDIVEKSIIGGKINE